MAREPAGTADSAESPQSSDAQPKGALTRQDIADAIYAACPGVSRRQAKVLVDDILEEIASALVKGDRVSLHGFGKFVVRHKNPRVGRNPRTGDAATVVARRVVVFRPSDLMKTKVEDQ